MRFVIAIVLFVVSAVMIVVGIAQRTVFAPPDAIEHSIEVTGDASLIVIDGATLNAVPGRQTISISGSGPIIAAYGRTVDVTAWVGTAEHAVVRFDDDTTTLVSEVVDGSTDALPSPFGSDLWLDDYQADGTLRLSVTVPDDVSFVIASDGTAPAPSDIELSWPVDNSNPTSGWFIILGGGVLVVGLVVLLWAIHHMRSTRGPRRKMPKVPKQRAFRAPKSRSDDGVAGMAVAPAVVRPATPVRSRSARAAAGVLTVIAVLVGLVAVGPAASAESTADPTPTPTGEPAATEPIPAITTRQIDRIVERVSATLTEADTNLDATLAATRLTGAALALRTADYAIRTADSSIASAVPVIPAGATVRLALPQQVPANGDGWPRSVLVVLAAAEDDAAEPTASVALMLTQASARENYKVASFVTLQADVPKVAETAIGAAKLAPDTALLTMTPQQVGLAYADVLANGDASEYASRFDLTNDSLVSLWGAASIEAIRAALPAVAQAQFATTAGTNPIISLATFDAGAIVAVDLNQSVTVTPTEAGATVSPTGSVKALSGVESSDKGIVATYGAQLLFLVPSVDSTSPIILLGYSQGLVSAGTVP